MGQNNKQRRAAKAKAKARRASRQGAGGRGTAGPGAGGRGTAGPGQGAAFFREHRTPGGAGRSPAADHRWTVQEKVRDLAQLALWEIAHDPAGAEPAQAELVRLASAGHGRAVGQQLSGLLRERLHGMWRRGWEPADLHRVVARDVPGGRKSSGPEQEVLEDAMVAELGAYAAGTVEPRWWDQLSELEARPWWTAGLDHLSARVDAGPLDWGRICLAALRVLDLIGRLPELQVLGPLPGQADAAAHAAAERAGKVDDRILRRVRALLAKAESTNYEPEAETFTAGAQAMMARHSIDAAMLDAAKSDTGHARTGPRAIRIGIEPPYERARALLLDRVAAANRCRTVWSKELGFSTVLGFGPDLRAVETLFTSLLVQSTAAMQREGSRRTQWGQSRTRSFRQSFLTAYASRIGERLAAVTREEEDRAAGSGLPATDAPGTDPQREVAADRPELLPVLVARSAEVDEATTAMFPHLIQGKASRISDAEGWHRGRAAADQASLAAFQTLPASS